MTDKREAIDSIWRKVDELEASLSQKPDSHQEKAASTSNPASNKIFAIGFCGLILLAAGIFLIGETACWITLGLVPAAYLIDEYSRIEKIRSREAEFFNF